MTEVERPCPEKTAALLSLILPAVALALFMTAAGVIVPAGALSRVQPWLFYLLSALLATLMVANALLPWLTGREQDTTPEVDTEMTREEEEQEEGETVEWRVGGWQDDIDLPE